MAVDLPKLDSQHRTEKKPKTHPITIGALSALEEKFGLPNAAEVIEDRPSATHLCFLAWHSRMEAGDEVADFEEWRSGLLFVKDAEDPKNEGPTDPG